MTIAPALRARRRGERGQAIVLGALTMLVLALMMAASFNLGNALHEKIRIQQHADALAFSMATVEARAMNYFAYSNRAMAAAYVAMTSMHAYMVAASVTVAMLRTASKNFLQVAAVEASMCCCGKCCCCNHCFDAVEAIGVSGDFSDKADDYADSLESLDSDFKNTIDALDNMVDLLHVSQLGVLSHTVDVLRGNRLDLIRRINAPASQPIPGGVGALNVGELACALEGTTLSCTDSGRSPASVEARAKVMTEVANATRPEWPAHRGGSGFPVYLNPQFLNELMHDIQSEGMTMPSGHAGTAKMVDDRSSGALESTAEGVQGKVCGAEEHGSLASQWRHGAGAGTYKAEIYSDANGGKHEPSDGHSGNHDFEGVNSRDTCTAQGNCFINFRATNDVGADFGQPHVYAYVIQDLRHLGYLDDGKPANTAEAAGLRPWEINPSGRVELEHGDHGTGKFRLTPDEGAAVSKALVYFHRLGEWRDPPNLFNPYWRAKLHPFKAVELERVLSAAGDTEAATMTRIAPVN